MELVALLRTPPDVDAAVAALAETAGLPPAEARMRLAPEPPALLGRLPPDRAAVVVAALRRVGVTVLVLGEEDVPSDTDRLQVRSFGLDEHGATFTARDGTTCALPWGSVRLVLRGIRVDRTRTEQTETSRSFSMGRAILTGGLVLTRKTSSTVHNAREDTEQFLLIHGAAGERVMLAEHAVEFSGLGPRIQPVRSENMAAIAEELRRRAPGAFHDDRLLRLGRRALPFLVGGSSEVHSATASVRRADTRGTVDVLAEVLDRALREGLLP